MIYKIKEKKDILIEKTYKKAMKDLGKFYDIDWSYGRPNVIVLENRKQIDQLRDAKTESWLVGWSTGQFIYVLDKKSYKEDTSNKYSEAYYISIICHELCHSFYSILSGKITSPRWLCEGIAIYTSGQIRLKKVPEKFETFLDFYNTEGSGVYSESGFAVELLINKYGKDKVLNLIKNLKNYHSKELFASAFEKEFGFDLNYDNFNSLLIESK